MDKIYFTDLHENVILRSSPLVLAFAADLPFCENICYKYLVLPVFLRQLDYNHIIQFSPKTPGQIPNISRVGK